MTSRLALVGLLAALVGCQPSAPAPAADATDAAVAAPETTPAPEPAPADEAAAAGYDERIINFGGYATARFNDGAEAVRRAFGAPLAATPPPASPQDCHYLMTRARGADGFGLAFMMEGGKFVRYDVDSRSIVAPGGLAVGSSADDVRAAFADRISEQPHKYVEGAQVLVVRPAEGGEARLVFETDADGIVTSWRIGLEPQVHYVEGCS